MVWPTQQQLVTYFTVVLVFVLVMIAFVSVLDLAFGKAVFAIFGGKCPQRPNGRPVVPQSLMR